MTAPARAADHRIRMRLDIEDISDAVDPLPSVIARNTQFVLFDDDDEASKIDYFN